MLHVLCIVLDVFIILLGIYGIGLSLQINNFKDLLIDIIVAFLGVVFLLKDIL